jgi:formylglycine-generating enzyme required for sulfatase activity
VVRSLGKALLLVALAGAWLARPEAAEACGTWVLHDRDLGVDAKFFINYLWPPWAGKWLLPVKRGTPGVSVAGDTVTIRGRKFVVEIEFPGEKCKDGTGGDELLVRVVSDGQVVAESERFHVEGDCGTPDEQRRLVAAYLVWREKILGAVNWELRRIRKNPERAIPRLAGSVSHGQKRNALVSALVLGRIGAAAIPALSEIAERPVGTPRELVAAQMAITALGNVGAEARPILERLAGHQTTDMQTELKAAATSGCFSSPTGRGGAMCAIPAGEFFMGCNKSVDWQCGSDEKPGKRVTLSAYYMDEHEVTVTDYKACVDAGACSSSGVTMPYSSDEEQPEWAWACNWGKGRDDHPMNCIDWNQARGYCAWAEKRLPSEAEWEKAARGTDGRKYPWGNAEYGSSGKVANIADETAHAKQPGGSYAQGYDDGYYGTSPSRSYPAGKSPYGLFDMIGNVWEWTSSKDEWKIDWYVVRGGSWGASLSYARASSRPGYGTTRRSVDGGVRCAVSPAQIGWPLTD